MFSAIKSEGLKFLLNKDSRVSRIAEILDIKLEKGRAALIVKLKGDIDPVSISFDYAIEDDGNELRIANIKSDREWINGAAEVMGDRYSRVDLSKADPFVKSAIKFLF
jgi:hypothetical protein